MYNHMFKATVHSVSREEVASGDGELL